MDSTRLSRAALTLMGIALLHGCAPMLPSGDRPEFCRVEVEEKFDAIVVEPNFAIRHGAVESASAGAAGVSAITVPAVVHPSPLFAPAPAWAPGVLLGGVVVGVIAGVVSHQQCLAEMQRVPNAEADFEKIVKSVDAGSLKRAMLAELDAQRPECAQARRKQTTSGPDAVIEIGKIAFERGCGTKKQTYTVSVRWLVVKAPSAGDRHVHGPRTTVFVQASSRQLEAWLASPDGARMEIEGVMARVARWLVTQMTKASSSATRDPPLLHVSFPDDATSEPGGHADQ